MGLGKAAHHWLLAAVALVALGGAQDGWAKRNGYDGPPECGKERDKDIFKVFSKLEKRGAELGGSDAIQLSRAAVDSHLGGGDATRIVAAYNTCSKEKKHKKAFRLPALVCMGDSALILAQERRSRQHYEQAYCAYEVATRLMAKDGVTLAPESAAEIHEGRAKALIGLYRSGGEDPDRYQSGAIAAYGAAIESNPTVSRHVALAEFYLSPGMNSIDEALGEATAAAKLDDDGSRTAQTLITIAERLESKLAPPEKVLGVLDLIKPSRDSRMATSGAKGLAYFRMGDLDKARSAFTAAAKADTNSLDTQVLYNAEAQYHLGWLEASDIPGNANAKTRAESWKGIIDRADAAYQLDGNARNRRLACVARLAHGGDYVTNDDVMTWCDIENDTSAEGYLVRGILHLRRAKAVGAFSPNRANPSAKEESYLDSVEAAAKAFEDGIEQVGGGAPTASYGWPGLENEADLTETLQLGLDWAPYVRDFCGRRNKRPTGADEDAFALLQRFGALDFSFGGRCKPPRK